MAGEKVTGKTLKYWQNSVEQAINSLSFGRQFTMLEATTTATTSPGTESTPGRAKTPITINTPLLTALGAEVTTGTLTAGVKYLVTAVDTVLSAYSVGEIFTAAGTEAMSSTDKVKALGAKVTGKDMSMTYAGGAYGITEFNYNVTYTEFDGTTTATATPNMDSVAGRHKITSSITTIMARDAADKLINAAPSAIALVITLGTSLTITGNAIFSNMNITDEVNGIVLVTYDLEWQNVPVEVGIGYLTLATEQAAEIIYETGSSTNKEVTGTVLLLTKSVSSSATGDTLIDYTGVFNGAITPGVYS